MGHEEAGRPMPTRLLRMGFAMMGLAMVVGLSMMPDQDMYSTILPRSLGPRDSIAAWHGMKWQGTKWTEWDAKRTLTMYNVSLRSKNNSFLSARAWGQSHNHDQYSRSWREWNRATAANAPRSTRSDGVKLFLGRLASSMQYPSMQ